LLIEPLALNFTLVENENGKLSWGLFFGISGVELLINFYLNISMPRRRKVLTSKR
jgi:hypothetical protein